MCIRFFKKEKLAELLLLLTLIQFVVQPKKLSLMIKRLKSLIYVVQCYAKRLADTVEKYHSDVR